MRQANPFLRIFTTLGTSGKIIPKANPRFHSAHKVQLESTKTQLFCIFTRIKLSVTLPSHCFMPIVNKHTVIFCLPHHLHLSQYTYNQGNNNLAFASPQCPKKGIYLPKHLILSKLTYILCSNLNEKNTTRRRVKSTDQLDNPTPILSCLGVLASPAEKLQESLKSQKVRHCTGNYHYLHLNCKRYPLVFKVVNFEAECGNEKRWKFFGRKIFLMPKDDSQKIYVDPLCQSGSRNPWSLSTLQQLPPECFSDFLPKYQPGERKNPFHVHFMYAKIIQIPPHIIFSPTFNLVMFLR
ncbi:hypothetical protein EGR_03884 [Echinococcus granulosus]|uniref:Uncharacterized protein n=1 Tax=Echinococcus granulosus TaxID=6210 RepID=W6V4T0_ECHGR|nr:hypothetical protein EGR_03884 [Echinococcus granulosus]EUB61209.1 hypothetical protein EGR_03884 [Echinococcus granulosus]